MKYRFLLLFLAASISAQLTLGQNWIWPRDYSPVTEQGDDGRPVNLGLRFRSASTGLVRAIRFWKQPGNTGTNTGAIWTENGTLLAQVTFTGETASGWQTATFSVPVSIDANTTYVASYYCPSGTYSRQANYFNPSLGTGTYNANPPLMAPADGLFGPNGLYTYAGGLSFPNQGAFSTNYWVDVQFEPTGSSTPAPPAATGSSWIWPEALSPSPAQGDDGRPVNLGMRFRSSQDGFISSIRFWKRPGNNGIHTGSVWTAAGTLLGEAVFTNETASGWQVARFPNPIPVSANTTYIASYFCPLGQYSREANYFNTASGTGTYSATPPLSAPADGLYGPNGLYAYAAASAFPGQSAGSTNYWVDVQFQPTATTTTPVPEPAPAPPPPGLAATNTWIWPENISPSPDLGDDGRPVNLGVRFRSSADGRIRGIRFWKRAGITGTHTGSLWTSSGTRLAEASFTQETAGGWQVAMFSEPVNISANTTYIASYFCPAGNYARQPGYFNPASGTGTYSANPPLSAPADGLYGPNGLFAYANTPTFPTQSASSSNYWVDVLFESNAGGGTTEPPPGSTPVQGTTTYSLPVIPFSEPDIIAPFRGGELWHYGPESFRINAPTDNSLVQPLDFYHRLRWDQLETAMGVYSFDLINNIFNEAISRKQKVSLGVMTQIPGQGDGAMADGRRLAYPVYLHSLMQNEQPDARDWVSPRDPSIWVPNYNSPFFLARFEALLQALAQHINTQSFNGVRYRDALGYIDIRGYGSWGEWNMVNIVNSDAEYPAGRKPTAASLTRIVDAHRNAFPDNPLVALVAAFDGNRYPNLQVPPEVGYHILNATNNWGRIGWRMDSYGWTDAYLRALLEENSVAYNGMRFDTAIMNRYRYAPVVGEGPCGGTANGGPHPFWYIPQQVRRYHTSILGNGNWCGEQFSGISARDSVRMAWKLSGYRIQAISADIPSVLQSGGPFSVTMHWLNSGLAPVYENWNISFLLQEESTGIVRWSGPSAFRLRFFQPGATATPHTDAFTLPGGLPGGRYRLLVRIADPSNFRDPFFLANAGRNPDGSYLVASGLNLQGTAQALSLSINAGADIVIPSTATAVTLSGQAVSGSIAAVSWSVLSGPGGTLIATPGSLTTEVTGLVAGVYVFRLTVTDTGGQTAYDDLVVIVYNPSTAGRTSLESLQDGASAMTAGGVRIYPVPVQRGAPLVVEVEPGVRCSLELVSVYGKILERKSFTGTIRLETANLPAGSYLARIHAGNRQVTRKIMILR
jgi:hypothetical protein